MTIFTINELRKTFTAGKGAEKILKGIDLALQQGEITALVGAAGSGKSTLLTIAAGLQLTSDGQILFDGRNMTNMNQEQIRKLRTSDFSFVLQSAHLVPFLTVEEQLFLMLEVSETTLKKHSNKRKLMIS